MSGQSGSHRPRRLISRPAIVTGRAAKHSGEVARCTVVQGFQRARQAAAHLVRKVTAGPARRLLDSGDLRIGCKEHVAHTAIGMPERRPEVVTRRPSRGEWRQLAPWLAELLTNDEYAEVIAERWPRDQDRR